MYTILMDNNKKLIQSKRGKIYQKENNVDKITFLFPPAYDGFDLSNFVIVLKYRDLGNEPHAEFLEFQPELYKGKLRSIYKVTSDFTRFASDIKIHLSFVQYDSYLDEYDEVFHTSETTITVLPTDIFTDGYPNEEELELYGKMIINNKTQIDDIKESIESIEENQVDDIEVNDNILQVSSNGKTKGDGVQISALTGNPSKLSNLDIENILQEGGL